jgi:hypothetical protein
VDRARRQLLAGAALAEEEDRGVRLAGALEHREDLAHRHARADQAAEARLRARRDRQDLVRRHQLQERAAEAEGRAGRHRGPVDGDPVDQGAVARAEVGDDEALLRRRHGAMAPRDRLVGEVDVGRRIGADHHAERRQGDLEARVRAGEHPQVRGTVAGARPDLVRDPRDPHRPGRAYRTSRMPRKSNRPR